jgi:hypothetical protein
MADTQQLFGDNLKRLKRSRKFGGDIWLLTLDAIAAGAAARLPEILHVLGFGP